MPYQKPRLERQEIEVTLGGLFEIMPADIEAFAITVITQDGIPRVMTCCDIKHAVKIMSGTIMWIMDDLQQEDECH